MTNNHEMKIFALSQNQELAKKVASILKTQLVDAPTSRFADGEIQININESVRNDKIFIIQSTAPPVNESLMEVLILIDALKRASAAEINVVIPYYGYSRQERKTKSRQPITAKLVANMLEVAGADRVIMIDLHASQIQGFFDIPTDNLTAENTIAKYLKTKFDDTLSDFVVVSPDHGGVRRARRLSQSLNTPLAIIDKRRPNPNEVAIQHIIGDIKGKKIIMFDDMIDTAGTLVKAADALIEKGATEVYAAATHGIFTDPAITNIQKSKIKKVFVTNSIEQNYYTDKIEVIDIADLVAKAINNSYTGTSMGELFGG